MYENSMDDITTTNVLGLKKGYYNKLTIIDSAGYCFRVRSAEKLHGIGFLHGYNIFLNQRIRVKLSFEGEPFSIPFEEVRVLVLKVMQTPPEMHFGDTRGDYEELLEDVKKAQSIREIIYLLGPDYAQGVPYGGKQAPQKPEHAPARG